MLNVQACLMAALHRKVCVNESMQSQNHRQRCAHLQNVETVRKARKSIRVSIAQKTNKCCSPGVFSQTALGVRCMPAAVIRSNMGSETELSFL